MNTHAQFDLHPDAESLNAFAEQALGEREREEVMAHLAVCGRCREVVFLAQEAAGLEVVEDREEELVLAAPMRATAMAPAAARAGPAAPRRRWYRSWWMMWVPVGALAAIVVLLTVMYVRQSEQKSEMAKNVPVVTPPTQQSELPPPAVPATNAAKREPAAKQKAGSAGGQRQAEAKGELESRAFGIGAPPPPAAAPEANKPIGGGRGESLQAPGDLMASSRSEGREEEKKAAPEMDKEQDRAATAVVVHPPEASAAPAPPPRSATETVTVNAEDQIVTASAQAAPEPEGNLKATHGALAAGTFAAYKAPFTRLPSGLAAVSLAKVERSVLGVDKTGSVFFSEDAGMHWQAVARQWNGRAVAVRTPEPRKKEEAGGEPAPVAKFELVNEEGKVWVSGDGRTWKVKQDLPEGK